MAKIFIDPGHGAHDPGAVGSKSKEKDNVLKVAKKIKKDLEALGHTVKLSRSTDVFLSLSERARQANAWGADVFISLHNNAATASATGFETFVFNGNISAKTRELQKSIHDEIMKEIGIRDRGKKRANFAVLRLSNMPAVLIEYAFISNKTDEKILINEVNKLARLTANGVSRFFGGKVDSKPLASSKPSNSKSSTTTSKPKTKWVKVTGNWTGQTLRHGHYGKPVEQLQAKVGAKVDGYFGDDTEKKVRQAQKNAGIKVDGLAGKDTYRVLSASKSKANLKIDGKWGKELTKALQRALGMKTIDGILSGQPRNSVTSALYGCVSYGSSGSPTVKALQRKVGSNPDGKMGKDTVRKLQRYLGTPVDGVISQPTSTMVKELQKRLNAGTF